MVRLWMGSLFVLVALTAGCRQADDERLAANVRQRLAVDPAIAVANIQVTAEDGVVRLRGSVPNDQVRQHAVFVVRQVDGVRDVTQELEIQPLRPRAEDLAPVRKRQ